jgi:hypothetical protein
MLDSSSSPSASRLRKLFNLQTFFLTFPSALATALAGSLAFRSFCSDRRKHSRSSADNSCGAGEHRCVLHAAKSVCLFGLEQLNNRTFGRTDCMVGRASIPISKTSGAQRLHRLLLLSPVEPLPKNCAYPNTAALKACRS